jgi:type II secretory pathway pseudopilin PulG
MKTAYTEKRAQRAFTLAEVLAALMFMAIVIPVTLQGLRIASRAGEVAQRKSQAVRIAENVLNESLVLTNWMRNQRGTTMEGVTEFQWSLHSDRWNMDASAFAPSLVTVEVTFPVQNQKYSVNLSTLASQP